MTTAAHAGHSSPTAPALPAMIRAAWRDHAAALAVQGGVAAALIAGMLLSHPYNDRPAAELLRQGCFSHPARPNCSFLRDWLASHPDWLVLHGPVAIALLMCVFAGAPLLPRELARGPQGFAGARAAGVARWACARVLALGAAVTVVTVPLALVTGWWIEPYERAGLVHRWLPSGFLLGAPTYASWVILALCGGLLAGVLAADATRAAVAAVVAFGLVSVLGAQALPDLLVAVSPRPSSRGFWLSQGLAAACLLAAAAVITASAIRVTRRRLS